MILFIHLLLLLEVCFLCKLKYKPNQLYGFELIFSFVAGSLFMAGFTGTALVVGTYAITALTMLTIYGGVALALTAITTKKAGLNNSPTYSQATLQTQTNPDLPIPLLYGTVKLAGNRIWQNSTSATTIKRVIAFAEGEIEGFDDIRLNDIKSNKIKSIKIKKYLGTSDQTVDSIVDGNTLSDRIKKVGSLRNIAYLAISVPRSPQIDINYNLTAIVKGRKVRVYYTPQFYEVKYSENPAWVLFDFLTAYNGLGIALNNSCEVDDNLVAELFDLETFIESAAYCDELISYTDNDGNVKYSPRFTFNMIFDSQTSARDLIDEIYRACRGGLFTHNGKLQFKIDKAEPVSLVITEQDIVKGSETFQIIPAEEHYDILRLSYISPEHEWQKVEAYAEIPNYRFGAPIEHNVNLYSCTNFQQASRLAWYYINAKELCPYFGSFQTDYRAYSLEVGDVVQINSLLMGLTNYKVKVTSVNDDGNGNFTVNWRNYDERLYGDTLGSKEPYVLVSDLSDIAVIPDDVQNFNVVQSQNYFNFVWQFNDDKSDTYEIRYGDSWDNGTVIGKRIEENNYTWLIPTDGLYKFWIKAFNNYNYSENATLDIYNVDSIPDINEIVKIDILNNMEGTFNNVHAYHHSIKPDVNSNVLWHETENYWGEDEYYQTNGYWGASVIGGGDYTSQVYDIGGILNCIVAFEQQYISTDESQDVLCEWRFSSDNVDWTDWILCNIGEYTFRYCQFKVTLRADNEAPIVLNTFNVAIDVPDKEIELDVETDNSGTLNIDYNFINEPSIIGTVNDNINAYVVIKNKTNTSATVYTYLNDNTPTAAKVNLRLKGY